MLPLDSSLVRLVLPPFPSKPNLKPCQSALQTHGLESFYPFHTGESHLSLQQAWGHVNCPMTEMRPTDEREEKKGNQTDS